MLKTGTSSLMLTLAMTCFSPTVSAQQEADAGYYDGKWTAVVPCPTGPGVCSASVVIEDFAGTWQDRSGRRVADRICGGKKLPLTVQSSTRSQLAFTVFGDGVSTACPTLSIFVRPINEKNLEGSMNVGLHPSEPSEVHASHSSPSESPGDAAKATVPNPAAAIRLRRR